MKTFCILVLGMMFASQALGALHLPSVIASKMVLQQGQRVPIWGWVDGSAAVTVRFAGQTKTATPDALGKWMVYLDPLQASATPRSMTISAGGHSAELTDVLVGEVWLASGQSNMEWNFAQIDSSERNVALSQATNQMVRAFHVDQHLFTGVPMDDTAGRWKTAAEMVDPIRNVSAVGFFFAVELQKKLGVPVAFLDVSWGGQPIQCFVSRKAAKDTGYLEIEPEPTQEAIVAGLERIASEIEGALEDVKKGRRPHLAVNMDVFGHAPNGTFNAMLSPLAPFAIKGAIWYQGEANRGQQNYFTGLQALSASWSEAFGVNPLPLCQVQIAPFRYNRKMDRDTSLPETIWRAQYRAAQEIPGMGVIPIHDTGIDVMDIHPRFKKPVGERLAAHALRHQYGRDVVATGPRFDRAVREGREVVVSFRDVDQGLETSNGEAPSWFELSADGQNFVDAKAVLDGNTVRVSCLDAVPVPKFVRMGWDNVAIPNLRDKNGWPVFAFPEQAVGQENKGHAAGTDSLPVLTQDQVPTSVEALWEGYDPDAEPLEVEVIREWKEDGCIVRYLTYTIGTFKGEKAVMAAFYAAPESPKGKIPGLIQMHGGGQRAMVASAKYGAENGYACLSINWGGREMEGAQPGEPTTDWGAVNPTQKHNSHYSKLLPDPPFTLDSFESPRNNNWFLITLGAKRGISFLQQQPEVDGENIGAFGHSMGGFLTVMLAGADARVKASAPSCGGSGSAPPIIRNRSHAGVRSMNSDLYHQTIDPAEYAKRIRTPILYVGPHNDFNGILDNMYENWKAIPSETVGYAVTPHMNHRATPEFAFANLLWFEDHLKGTFDYPGTPKLTVDLEGRGGVPVAVLAPEQIDRVTGVEVFYSVDPHILTRFWRRATVERNNAVWTAALPVTSTEQPLYVMANVYYGLDHEITGYAWMREAPARFGVSSEMRMFSPHDLRRAGVKGDGERTRMIDESCDLQDWYQLNYENPLHWAAYTRKVKDPRYRGPDAAELAFDIQVDEDTSFFVHVQNNSWSAYRVPRGDYYATVSVEGSPEWQTVRLGLADFRPAKESFPPALTSWRHLTELGLCARVQAEIDGKPVQLPARESLHLHRYPLPRKLRNLRWEGGEWRNPIGAYGFSEASASDANDIESSEFQEAIDDSIQLEKLDEAETSAGRVYLRKAMATAIDSFWRVMNDKGVEGGPISVAGRRYERGLGVHAPSRLEFHLNKKFKTFHVVPGPDDAHHGKIEMIVLVDGKEIYASGTIARKSGPVVPLVLPVQGASRMTLIVREADGKRGGDHACWADAYLTR